VLQLVAVGAAAGALVGGRAGAGRQALQVVEVLAGQPRSAHTPDHLWQDIGARVLRCMMGAAVLQRSCCTAEGTAGPGAKHAAAAERPLTRSVEPTYQAFAIRGGSCPSTCTRTGDDCIICFLFIRHPVRRVAAAVAVHSVAVAVQQFHAPSRQHAAKRSVLRVGCTDPCCTWCERHSAVHRYV
jgi:hypothetical protein